MSNAAIVVLTLVFYQGVLLAIGYWAKQRSSSTTEYLIGDYQLGPWVAALSYAAGSSSAWSILGDSGIAFSQGLSAFWLLPGTLLGHLVVWFYIAPRLQAQAKQSGWVTLTDVLAKHLPANAKRQTYGVAAIVVLVSFIFYIAAQFQGAANTFAAVFDLNFFWSLVIGAAVVLVYTLWGGFWAVSATDALQALLMLFASILLPWVALEQVGGIAAILEHMDTSPFWLWQGQHQGWFVLGFFIGMLSIGFGPIGQPHLLNRVMALRNAQAVGLARTVALVWFVVVLGGMFVTGLLGHLLLTEIPPGGSN